MNIPIEIEASIVSRPIQTRALAFADNPQPRCPVVLLLDCSSSMAGSPIEELDRGVAQFYRELKADPIASMSVEVCVIPFGEQVGVSLPFKTVAETSAPNGVTLAASGMTPMGAAVRLGLGEIAERRKLYRRSGVSAYKPWMVLLTDGQPNDDWQPAAMQVREMAIRGELMMVGVGIGSGVDMLTLGRFVPPDPGPYRLAGLQFANFFRWLSDSLRVVSSGSTVVQRALPNPNHYDWNV
jgi:uncharacterized protein YegL